MSRIVYEKCDQCGKEVTLITFSGQRYIHLSCGVDTKSFPHGDFCSIPCVIDYLNNWKLTHTTWDTSFTG